MRGMPAPNLARRIVLFGVSASVLAIILELYFHRIAARIVSPPFFHPSFALGDVIGLVGVVALLVGSVMWACRASLPYLAWVAVSVGVGAFFLGKAVNINRHPNFILMIFAVALICVLLLLIAAARLVLSRMKRRHLPATIGVAPNPISFSVQLAPTDFYRAILSITARRSWWISLLIVLPSLLILLANPEQRHGLVRNFTPLFVLCAVWLVMFLAVPIWTSRSLFQSQKSAQGNNRYTFSAQEIQVQSETTSVRTSWSNIYRVKETKSFFLVYLSKYVYWLIPKKAISDADKIDALRQMFEACVQGKVSLYR